MSNKYLVYITGTDSIGYSFMQNVIEMASKGAILQEGKIPCMRFPHSAYMILNTHELMESKPGFRFQIIHEHFTKEQLDDMEWEDLKKLIKKATGKTGRDRQLLTNYYLKVIVGEEPEAE
jgi:hypothetical protein